MKELSKQRTKEEDQNRECDEKKEGKFTNGSDFE